MTSMFVLYILCTGKVLKDQFYNQQTTKNKSSKTVLLRIKRSQIKR